MIFAPLVAALLAAALFGAATPASKWLLGALSPFQLGEGGLGGRRRRLFHLLDVDAHHLALAALDRQLVGVGGA